MGNPAVFAIFHRLSSCIKKGNYVEIFFLVSNIVEMLLLAPKEETLGNNVASCIKNGNAASWNKRGRNADDMLLVG